MCRLIICIHSYILHMSSSSHGAPPSMLSSSFLDMKLLPNTLKYVFLGLNETFPVIHTNDLNSDQESQVLDLLRENQEALGWTLGDIHCISPTIVQHRIHLEDNVKPC